MAGITQFEVQVQQGGRWSIHAQYGPFQKDAALNEAKGLANTFPGVKVVREVYDPAKGVSHEFVIWKNGAPTGGGDGGEPAGGDEPEPAQQEQQASWLDAEGGDEDDEAPAAKPRKKKGGGATLTSVVVKLLFVALFSIAIAAFFTFLTSALISGKTLFGMRISGNLESNILFMMFVISFLVSAIGLAMGALRKTELEAPKRRVWAAAPAPAPAARPKKKKKKALTPSGAEGSSVGDSAAADLQKAAAELRADAGGEAGGVGEGEDEDQKRGVVLDAETYGQAEGAPTDLSPHAEKQKAYMMQCLKEALAGSSTAGKKLDNFNKFGVNLWLAGACEVLGQKRDLDDKSRGRILSDSVQVMGFKKSHAGAFSEKYEEYLLQDARYMQMFQAGRNAMNMYLTNPDQVPKHLDQALGEWNKPKPKEEAPKVITVLFTDIAGSTAMTQKLGDAGAQEVVRAHNRVVREALTQYRGREVKHTGDGIMASFDQASDSVEAAIMMQRGAMTHNEANPNLPLHLKIGINAGEPIQEDNDLFGTTVQMSARIVDKAQADEIFVSEIIRGICQGKPIQFYNRGGYPMKGFSEDPTLYEVIWRQAAAAE